MKEELTLFRKTGECMPFMDALPILNEEWIDKRSITSTFEAYEDIINVLNNSKEKVTLLFTGPLTDLAKAIKYDKTIVNNIEKLVWMGGTFLEKGNVEEPNMMAQLNGMLLGS